DPPFPALRHADRSGHVDFKFIISHQDHSSALLMRRSERPILKKNGPLGTRWPPLLSLLLTSLWFARWRCGLMRRGERCHARRHARRSSGLRSTLLLFAALLACCLLRRGYRCHARLHARRSSGLRFALGLLLFAALLAFHLLRR